MERISTYLAIIGDLVDSKKIIDREMIQNNLVAVLVYINEKYSQFIISKFLIKLGG